MKLQNTVLIAFIYTNTLSLKKKGKIIWYLKVWYGV